MMRTLVVPGLLAVLAATAGAQTLSDSTIATLRQRELLRASAEGKLVSGTFGGRRSDSLTFRSPSDSIRLSIAAIDTLWRPYGRQAGRGARIGLITGAAMGALAMAVYTSSSEGEGSARDRALQFAPAGAVMGATVGTVAGALIGAASPKWRIAFSRP